MKHATSVLFVCASMLFGASATAQVQKPTTAVPPEGCVTDQCHSEIKDYPVVHGPVNIDACDGCHVPGDASKHEYTFARKKTELCTFCHQLDLGDAKVIHEPLKTGECLACHNPHGGFDRFALRGKDMRDACNTCHDDVLKDKRTMHGPAAAGACTVCHRPHAAEHEKLLVTEGRALCMMCHSEMDQQLQNVKFKHEAVEQDCSNCHDPHASNYPMQVKMPPVELCTSCHEPIKKAALDAANKHSVVVEGDACLNCHTAHGSDLAKLMKSESINVCMSCHAEAIEREGRTVASVAEAVDPDMIKHGPVRDGSCGGCHNIHGSDHVRLLVKSYPGQFYAPFKKENYDLCFSCHEQTLVLTKEAKGLTNFRDGDVNLHFVHVNKQKGRTCRACHATHASNFEVHVRESVPFGKWELPIDYRQTGNGGTCSPGCHQPLGYDRENPVNVPSEEESKSEPAMKPAPAKPAAEPDAKPQDKEAKS